MISTTMDVGFSPAVRAAQEARGSREAYAKMEAKRPWPDRVTPDLGGEGTTTGDTQALIERL